MDTSKPKVAIIGAGLAGLTAAHRLQTKASITIFEKSRGAGGRMATRYHDDYQFDIGAQYFTARTSSFKDFLSPYIESGIVKLWQPRFAEIIEGKINRLRQWDDSPAHYVACPKMTALCKAMASSLNIKLNQRVESITTTDKGWLINDSTDCYDWVISSAPAEQSAQLMPTNFAHHATISNIMMTGCNTLMLGFKAPLHLDWDAAFIKDEVLSWVSVNSTKPQRNTAYSLVVNSTNAWADKHIDDNTDFITKTMLKRLQLLLQTTLIPEHIDIQRWRYANVSKQGGPQCFVDEDQKLAVMGDWCIQGRIEAAFTSANLLSDIMLPHLDS